MTIRTFFDTAHIVKQSKQKIVSYERKLVSYKRKGSKPCWVYFFYDATEKVISTHLSSERDHYHTVVWFIYNGIETKDVHTHAFLKELLLNDSIDIYAISKRAHRLSVLDTPPKFVGSNIPAVESDFKPYTPGKWNDN